MLQLKQVLVEEVKKKAGVSLDAGRVRLREKVNLKLGKVFHNDDLLKSHRIYDRQPFVLEQLSHEEHTSAGQMILYVKLFNIFTYELSYPPEEVFVTQATTLEELAVMLSQRFSLPVHRIAIGRWTPSKRAK